MSDKDHSFRTDPGTTGSDDSVTFGEGGWSFASSTNVSVENGAAVPDTGPVVVDDFESGDITGVDAPWQDWDGDTGSFQAQQSTVLAGDWSGRLSSTDGISTVYANRDSNTSVVSTVRCLLEIDTNVGNSNDRLTLMLRQRDGVVFAQVEFNQGTNQEIRVPVNGTVIGNWSVGETYRIRAENVDFTAEEYDVDVVRVSDESSVASITGQSFENSVSGLGRVHHHSRTAGSGGSVNSFIDDIRVVE